MAQKPPAGLIERPEDLFRRTRREAAFILSALTRQYLVQFGVCLCIIALHLAILGTSTLERFEYIFLDYFFRTRPIQQVHPAIAYIEIAEDSIQDIGRWPWPRQYHAVMAHILSEWKAKAIVFDVLFSERSTELDDGALLEAFQKTDNIYLSTALEQQGNEKIGIHSLPELEEHAKGVGHINVTPDRDGTVRRITPYLKYGNEEHFHLALKVAYDYLGAPEKLKLWKPEQSFLINWTGKWADTFHHYSFVDIIKSYEAIQKGREPIISPKELEGKICLIGLTAFGHSDIKATPMEPAYPGVGIHANVINGLLTNQFIHAASFQTNMICLLVIGLIASILFALFRSVGAFIGGILMGIVWTFIAFLIFSKYGVWLYVMSPLNLIMSLYVFSSAYVLILRNKERLSLFRLATRDGLTGLYVIRHFRVLLNQAVGEAYKRKKPLSVILGDIDHFKTINDTHGHACGDMVLKGISGILQSVIVDTETKKETHIAGRYGGEELIVMLRGYNLQDAAFKMAETLRKEIEQQKFMWEGTPVSVTISLGVSTLHPHEKVPDLMVHRADEALYRAKENGRNRVCLEGDGVGKSA